MDALFVAEKPLLVVHAESGLRIVALASSDALQLLQVDLLCSIHTRVSLCNGIGIDGGIELEVTYLVFSLETGP